jgi:hypothetical protein
VSPAQTQPANSSWWQLTLSHQHGPLLMVLAAFQASTQWSGRSAVAAPSRPACCCGPAITARSPWAWIAPRQLLAGRRGAGEPVHSLSCGSSVVLIKLRGDPGARPVPMVIDGPVAIAVLLLGWSQGLLNVLEAAVWGVALLEGAFCSVGWRATAAIPSVCSPPWRPAAP